jgi:hypothetical protein
MVNEVHFYFFLTWEFLPCEKTEKPKGKGIFCLKRKNIVDKK